MKESEDPNGKGIDERHHQDDLLQLQTFEKRLRLCIYMKLLMYKYAKIYDLLEERFRYWNRDGVYAKATRFA